MELPFLSQTAASHPLLIPTVSLHSNGFPNGVAIDATAHLRSGSTSTPLESPDLNATTSAGASQVSVILTVRLLMQGKEVGSIIGKRGDNIKCIRERSGAKINISDGSCPERVVTITGNIGTINNAFQMIAQKFEEDLQALPNSIPKPPITMRLIVPATQCGSIIGKGGTKIKEIRERTGASIQVASEMLPNSTERAVTISGVCEALVECMKQICAILQESPPKGATLPFRPKPTYNPMLVASSAAAAAAAQQKSQELLTNVVLQQQLQSQQQQQSQNNNALLQAMLQQYGQSGAAIYSSLLQQQQNASKLAYPQLAASVPTSSTICSSDLQNALLTNLAFASSNPTLQLAQQQQQQYASAEDLQAALIAMNGGTSAALMTGWPTSIDTTSMDLFAAQFPTAGLIGQPQQQTQQTNRASGGKVSESIPLAQQTSKTNGTGRSSASSGVSSRRFTPY